MILWVRRKSGAAVETGAGGSRTFRTSYTVKSDLPRELRTTILDCGMLPVYGSPHSQDITATCVKVSPVQNSDNPFLWEVECEWSNQHTGRQNPTERQKQPDQRRPKWSFNFTPLQKTFFNDLDGKPFVDAAGTPFNPPPDIPIFVDEWTVNQIEASCDRNADREWMNATNSKIWLNVEPNEALVADLSRVEIYENGAYWFDTTYKILVNPKLYESPGVSRIGGWNPYSALNAGPRELDNSTPPKPIPIQTGEFYDGLPCPLTAAGKRILRNNDGTFESPPNFIGFRVVKSLDFAGLNLVPPWL